MPIGEVLVVDRPQVLEDQLGEAAGVAEDERGLVLLDQLHHLARGVAARMARPGNAAFGDEDRQVGLGAGIALDQADRVDVGVGREPAAIGVGIADRRADRPTRRRPGASAWSRDSDRLSRSPRLSLAKAWISSTTTVLRPSNSSALSG